MIHGKHSRADHLARSIVEINLGVLVACIPSYAPLLRILGQKALRGYLSQSQSRRNNTGPSLSAVGNDTRGSRLSRGLRGIQKGQDGSQDEEVTLWEARSGWGETGHGWSGDSVSMAAFQTKDGITTENGAGAERRGHESKIHVVRDISISSDHVSSM